MTQLATTAMSAPRMTSASGLEAMLAQAAHLIMPTHQLFAMMAFPALRAIPAMEQAAAQAAPMMGYAAFLLVAPAHRAMRSWVAFPSLMAATARHTSSCIFSWMETCRIQAATTVTAPARPVLITTPAALLVALIPLMAHQDRE